eukprot:m.132546 g.132546  ORF g.132546 m.132546 type:complete len:58 (-) comp14812_c0_seq1:734-907(-)
MVFKFQMTNLEFASNATILSLSSKVSLISSFPPPSGIKHPPCSSPNHPQDTREILFN